MKGIKIKTVLLMMGIFLSISLFCFQGDVKKEDVVNVDNKSFLIQINSSPNIDAHQGIATDGIYFYLFHTDFIKKTDKDWNTISINRNVLSEIGSGVNHLGDGAYYDGKLYVPVEYYFSWNNWNIFHNQYISVWNASDLSYVGKYDISAQNHEVAGIAVDNEYIYIVSYCNGSAIWKYKLSDFSYDGYITLSSNIDGIQGITKKDDQFYLSQSEWIHKVSISGIILESFPANVNGGIDYTQKHLYCLENVGEKEHVYIYKEN